MNHHRPSLPHEQTPCATFARLAPLLDTGELDPLREAWARDHLRTCTACQKQFAGYEIVTAALRRHYGGMRSPVSLLTAEDLMSTADMEATHEDTPTPPRTPFPPQTPQRRGWRRLLATALTAAMVLAVIGTLFALRGHTQLPSTGGPKTPKTTSTASGKVADFSTDGKLPSPTSIAVGKDGSVWFIDPQVNAIARIAPRDPTDWPPYTWYVWDAPTANSGLADLAIASDGSVWFTEANVNRIGRIIPNPSTNASSSSGGAITDFNGPNSGGRPAAIAAGADGVMWFTALSSQSFKGNIIAPIQPDGTIHSVIRSPYPDPPGYLSITRTPDGYIWLTEANTKHIDRIDPVLFKSDPGNALKQYSLPQSASGPIAIAAAPDNSVWFLEVGANAIWHMTPDGKVTEVPVPMGDHALLSLAVAPDGSVWFTEAKANKIGRLSPSGVITTYAVPTPAAGLSGIAIGPDGRVWFTESATGKYGYVIP